MELSASSELDTTLTGGCMRWPGAFSLVGPAALESINTVVMDKVFLGVCGVDVHFGATTIETDEAAIFRAMTRRGKQTIVVADSSKVGMISPGVICATGGINTLVTDDGIAEKARKAFERAGVTVLIA